MLIDDQVLRLDISVRHPRTMQEVESTQWVVHDCGQVRTVELRAILYCAQHIIERKILITSDDNDRIERWFKRTFAAGLMDYSLWCRGSCLVATIRLLTQRTHLSSLLLERLNRRSNVVASFLSRILRTLSHVKLATKLRQTMHGFFMYHRWYF